MSKTKAREGNSKKEECSSILEFLFNEQNENSEVLEGYIEKYLEGEAKWRVLFECIRDINITPDRNAYFCELTGAVKKAMPFLKMAIVIYNGNRNEVFMMNDSSGSGYLADAIFSSLNLYGAKIETAKYFNSKGLTPDCKFLPLETEKGDLGYIYFECENPYKEVDLEYFEKMCAHLVSVIETMSMYNGIKKEGDGGIENVACFSHEIKTPLNSVIAYTELLAKNSSSFNRDVKNYIENLCISSHQLKNLLNDIIENAKLKCGRITLRKQSFETKRAVEDVIKIFNCQTSKKNVTVKTVLMQASIISDYTKFNQILYNLISNAVKFSDEAGTIEIISWIEDEKYHFEIKNSGDYINKKDADGIFNFLHSTNQNGSKNPEGSGIGLKVSKQLTEALGGNLDFQSTKDGTTFRFNLPLKI